MIADARALNVKCIIIERLDRLSRDLVEQEVALRDLVTAGITLRSTCEADVMSGDATRVLFRQIVGAIAQYDRSMIVGKLAAARARIRATGARCDGRKPFGWHEHEVAVIERMKALRAEGLPYAAIADRLNDAGIPARAGQWHGRSVNRTLSQMRDRPRSGDRCEAAAGAL